MTETPHPLTEDRVAELWDGRSVKSYFGRWEHLGHAERQEAAAIVRPAFDVGREHERTATPADPHHDPRPWQDCTREGICAGDLVEGSPSGRLIIGVAHHQDEEGDWRTEDGVLLTLGASWPLRRIPAPTPPAEEVELPTGFGAVITDVEVGFGETVRLDRMVWTGCRWTYRDHSTVPEFVTAFSLPDGTRARRDGERADSGPRFVKEAAK